MPTSLTEPDSLCSLRASLLRYVCDFYVADGSQWKENVVSTLRTLQTTGIPAVFFGGTLRSLLLSRINGCGPGRPRDIDIVFQSGDIEDFASLFKKDEVQKNRFGGLKVTRGDWQFDLWPLKTTWALKRKNYSTKVFDVLPFTTFLNIEAIAVDVWTSPGKSRQVYSANESFFRAVLENTLELNYPENPYPELGVVRSLSLAASHNFLLGPKIACYIAEHGLGLTPDELEKIQLKHYGELKWEGRRMSSWVRTINEARMTGCDRPLQLLLRKQLTLWDSNLPH